MFDRVRFVTCCCMIGICIGCCIFGCIHSGGPRKILRVTASAPAAEIVYPDIPAGGIDINSADVEELTFLPGIGETIAVRIIDERNTNGPFRYPEDLLSVNGIGENKLNGMLPLICIPDGEEEK